LEVVELGREIAVLAKATVRAAAVDPELVGILDLVVARRDRAELADADPRDAVARLDAREAVFAGRAVAAAVDRGLVAVLRVVGARARLAVTVTVAVTVARL